MFYQTDEKLKFDADSDCYLFDILKIYELVSGVELTRDQVANARKVAVRAEFISNDGYLNNKGISGVANVVSGITGSHVYMQRVRKDDEYTHVIAQFGREGNKKFINHFVLATKEEPDNVFWDPWSAQGSMTVRVGYIIGHRYIFAEAI